MKSHTASFLLGPVAFALVALSWPSPQACAIDMPEAAHLVWRLAKKDGRTASACPVKTLKDGTTLFLTAKHVAASLGPAGATRAIVESRDKQRKLVIVSYSSHPNVDLAVLVVRGDGKPIPLFTLDLVGCAPGDRVYTAGFPGPTKVWFGYDGFMGLDGRHSAAVERGMSGGCLLDSAGSLSGIMWGHAFNKVLISIHDKGVRVGGTQFREHLPHQAISTMLHLHQKWLRKVGVIE